MGWIRPPPSSSRDTPLEGSRPAAKGREVHSTGLREWLHGVRARGRLYSGGWWDQWQVSAPVRPRGTRRRRTGAVSAWWCRPTPRGRGGRGRTCTWRVGAEQFGGRRRALGTRIHAPSCKELKKNINSNKVAARRPPKTIAKASPQLSIDEQATLLLMASSGVNGHDRPTELAQMQFGEKMVLPMQPGVVGTHARGVWTALIGGRPDNFSALVKAVDDDACV